MKRVAVEGVEANGDRVAFWDGRAVDCGASGADFAPEGFRDGR